MSARHFKHSSSLCSPTLAERVNETTAPQDCAAVPLGSSIYFTGVQVHYEACSTVHRYNINTQSWEAASSMQERRYYNSAVSYRDRCIYVFGGIESAGCINRIYKSSVERYDPQLDTWSDVASMQQPRRDRLACVFGNKIFLIGGESAECACGPNCEVYDPITDVWQMVCFQMKEVYTLKSCQDTGTFNNEMFCNESDPLELNVYMPQDEELYDHAYLYKPSVTYCNGCLIIFGFGSFLTKNFRLPFYFVDPDTGNFRTLYSLSSRPSETSRGIIMPLSRRDMIKALKDYPGNIC